MQIPPGIRPDERVLVLGVPEPAAVAALAMALSDGALVVMGEGDALYDGRAAARDLDNVMFVPGGPRELPWRDGFFTRVVDTVGGWEHPDEVLREIERVTARGDALPRSPNG